MKAYLVVIALLFTGLAACAAEQQSAGNARVKDPNRQEKVSDPTDDVPASPANMPGKGRGSETKWDRKLAH